MSLLNKDYYGNPQQNPTPTTKLLEQRNKAKQESSRKYLNGVTVWSAIPSKALVEKLKQIIVDLEEQPDKKFKFTLEVSEE